MMMTQEVLAGILRENGCFDFLKEEAKAAAEEILRACPDGAALLSDEAKQGLERGYCIRMEVLYLHPLLTKLFSIFNFFFPVLYLFISSVKFSFFLFKVVFKFVNASILYV